MRTLIALPSCLPELAQNMECSKEALSKLQNQAHTKSLPMTAVKQNLCKLALAGGLLISHFIDAGWIFGSKDNFHRSIAVISVPQIRAWLALFLLNSLK